MVTAVVETTMTAGNHGVATLTEIAMIVETKQEIPPLKEDIVNGTGVTTGKEVFVCIFLHTSIYGVESICRNMFFYQFLPLHK